MPDKDWLSIDHKACSPSQLVALIQQLDRGDHTALRLTLMGELVERLKTKGLSERQIIDVLLEGVTDTKRRDKIAQEWAPVFRMTAKAFKRVIRGT